jgi:hypothetical protein
MTLFYLLPGYFTYNFTLVALNFKLNWIHTFKKEQIFHSASMVTWQSSGRTSPISYHEDTSGSKHMVSFRASSVQTHQQDISLGRRIRGEIY